MVRRSDAPWTSWATVDDYTDAKGGGSALDAHEDGAGSVVVTGSVGNPTHLVTRRSDDDGASWQTVDDYQYASGMATFGGALAADGAGNLYAALTGTDAGGAQHWIVRKLACK